MSETDEPSNSTFKVTYKQNELPDATLGGMKQGVQFFTGSLLGYLTSVHGYVLL